VIDPHELEGIVRERGGRYGGIDGACGGGGGCGGGWWWEEPVDVVAVGADGHAVVVEYECVEECHFEELCYFLCLAFSEEGLVLEAVRAPYFIVDGCVAEA